MSSKREGQGDGRSWSLWLTLLALGLSAITGAVLWQQMETTSMHAVQSDVDALKPALTGLRILAIGLIALLWPKLVSWLSDRQQSDKHIREQRQALRWRVVTWLLIIELMLGQNLSGRFLTLLQVPTP